MASFSVERSKHASLVASTVDTVTLTKDYERAMVINRDGAAAIFFTTDGSTPTVEGDNTLVIPTTGNWEEPTLDISGTNVIKLISSGTPQYSVIGL